MFSRKFVSYRKFSFLVKFYQIVCKYLQTPKDKRKTRLSYLKKKSFFGKIEIYVSVYDRLGFDEFNSRDG